MIFKCYSTSRKSSKKKNFIAKIINLIDFILNCVTDKDDTVLSTVSRLNKMSRNSPPHIFYCLDRHVRDMDRENNWRAVEEHFRILNSSLRQEQPISDSNNGTRTFCNKL